MDAAAQILRIERRIGPAAPRCGSCGVPHVGHLGFYEALTLVTYTVTSGPPAGSERPRCRCACCSDHRGLPRSA